MMKKVLDSYALLVYLEKDPGFEKVESLLIEAAEKDQSLLMSAVNWAEVYYIVLREFGEAKAKEIEKAIMTLPIEVIVADQDLCREAARIKAHNPISFADCFAAALASKSQATLVTGDKEFAKLQNLIPIFWI